MKGQEAAYRANMGAKDGEIKHLQVVKGTVIRVKEQQAAYKATMGLRMNEMNCFTCCSSWNAFTVKSDSIGTTEAIVSKNGKSQCYQMAGFDPDLFQLGQ
jgi:hypothetical protein